MPPPALLLVAAGGIAQQVVWDISSLTLASLLVREVWKRTPEWIQKDIAFKKSVNHENEDMDELNSLSHVLSKLQNLLQVGREKMELSVTNWHIAFLLTVQLMAQVRLHCPSIRDEFYITNHNDDNDKKGNDNLEELRLMLDYAVWAYEDDTKQLSEWLQPHGFVILQHSNSENEQRGPGYVAYFVAINTERKEILVGVRGTYSLEDVITDCCGNAVPFYGPTPTITPQERSLGGDDSSVHQQNSSINKEMDDHNEINHSNNENELDNLAMNRNDNHIEIKEEVEICMIQNLDSGGETNKDVVFCNNRNNDDNTAMYCHEGIVVAAKRLVKNIGSVVQHFVNICGYKVIFSGHSLGAGVASLAALILSTNQDIHKDNMHVYAFASPPVVDYQTSIHSQSFITTIVNNSDIIPRSSMANLIIFTSFLKKVHSKHSQMEDDGNNAIRKSLLTKLLEGMGGDLLMSQEEIRNTLWNSQHTLPLQDPDHLYVPGRVILLHEPWEEKTDTCKENDIDDNPIIQKVTTDASHQVLRVIELDLAHSLTDHLTVSYSRNLDLLIAQNKSAEK